MTFLPSRYLHSPHIGFVNNNEFEKYKVWMAFMQNVTKISYFIQNIMRYTQDMCCTLYLWIKFWA